MMADVPIGVFLSGGLDSSLVAALMARHREDAARSGALLRRRDGRVSDLAAARRVADHLGLEHHERVYDADEVVAVLPEVVRSIESYEPSLVRSAVPNYLLAEETARTVKVVLTGEGADELFAGYAHYRDIDEADLRAELVRNVSGLHHLNLQRCDRVTMAYGLEARVPFLDRDVVNLAARIPIGWLLPGEHGEEKALLREAFDGLAAPRPAVAAQGAVRRRQRHRRRDGRSGWPSWCRRPTGPTAGSGSLPPPRSREELAYQRMFAERLDGVPAGLLGRFATE